VNRKLIDEKLGAYLAKNRLKSTSQRDAIVEAFLRMNGKHVTIEELWHSVRKKNPAVGYATVYRTLMLLVDAGIVTQRHFQDGQSQFEFADEHHHDHLICTECGKIVEFENEAIEKMQESIAAEFKFSLSGHRMELYGTCASCTGTKSRRAG
jgi:Fur family ferric uptake transcriptional regulator